MAVDRISQRSSLAGGGALVRGAPAGSGRFESLLAGPQTRADNLAGVPAAAEMPEAAPMNAASLVQAQVEDVFARQRQDKEARRHGMALLKALGAVQLAMLGSGDDTSQAMTTAIAALAGAVRDAPPADDAVLRLILREIGIRAAVELARRPPGQPGAADVSAV